MSAHKRMEDQMNHCALAVSGSIQQLAGLAKLLEPYTKSNENKVINPYHFTKGLKDKLTSGEDFFIVS